MAKVSNLHQVVFALKRHGQDLEQEVGKELDMLAQMAARKMRTLAPKWRSALTNSIRVDRADRVDAMVREVRPGMAYAEAMEKGIKPGGKGLPRFMDPASASIVSWLKDKAFTGQKRVRKNSLGAVMRNLELRDRYEGLAWHVRHKGIKAQPFVEPTAREMEPLVLNRLGLAVRRVLAARPDAAGSVGVVA